MSNNTSEIKNLPKLYGGKLSPEFNSNDFQTKKGFVTFQDLQNYANLYSVNIFYSLNQFFAISVKSINDISDTTLSYLKNVASDIQEQFNNIVNNILYNYSYDETNQLTSIENDTYLKTMSTNNNVAIAGKTSIADTLNTTLINNIKMQSKNIQTKTLRADVLFVKDCQINDTGVYLYTSIVIQSFGQSTVSILPIPIFQSTLISDLGLQPTDTFSGNLIIKPRYRVDIVDTDENVVFSYTNRTHSVIYFYPVELTTTINKINLFYNNIAI
jgi:hypothetical protein